MIRDILFVNQLVYSPFSIDQEMRRYPITLPDTDDFINRIWITSKTIERLVEYDRIDILGFSVRFLETETHRFPLQLE